jgi:hypothetical protein
MTKPLAVKRRRPRKGAKCPELYKLHDKLNLAYLNGANSYVNLVVLNQQFNSDKPVDLQAPLPDSPIYVRGEINAVEAPVLLPPSLKTAKAIRQHIRKLGLERVELVLAEFLKDVPGTTYVHRCDQFPDLSAVPYQFVVWLHFGVTIRAMSEGRYLLPYAEGYKLDRDGDKRPTYMESHVEQLLCIGCGPDFDGETIKTVLAIIQ